METSDLNQLIADAVAAVHMPYLPVRRYAQVMGETEGAVRKQVEEGLLPIKPRKTARGRVYINLEKLRDQGRNASY